MRPGGASEDKLTSWVSQVRSGDVRAIARAISAIENRDPAARDLIRVLFPHTGPAFLIGVTGAAGTGKSTLVDGLAAAYRERGTTVGIIAVDPTSPFTGGAILGDRIRMQHHAGDSGVYVRSMATRGSLGGMASATADAALVLDAAGKQVILIETVGVGQDEAEIARLADCTLVLVVPGLGDDVQNMKAGLMEIADVFVLNKSDREGADTLARQLEASVHLSPAAWQPPIVRSVASAGQGIPALIADIERFRSHLESSGRRRVRTLAQWERRLLLLLEQQVVERFTLDPAGRRVLDTLVTDVADRRTDPYAALDELMHSTDRDRVVSDPRGQAQ
jgi:LAO/AO transport system kinase